MRVGQIGLQDKYAHLEGRFKQALAYLESTDLTGMEKGSSIEIEDGVLVRMQHYTTSPAESLDFETHRHHFDIHYMVEGSEIMGCVYYDPDKLPTKGPYDEPTDTQYHQEPPCCGTVILHKGDYAIVGPEEAHKPRCICDSAQPVKKIVVKVRV